MNTSLGGFFATLTSISILAFTSSQASAQADALDNWISSQLITNALGADGIVFGGVAYGAGRYVAVGSYRGDDNGVIQTSEDGVNWTQRTSQNYSILDLYDVAFGNGIFVSVGWDWFNGYNIYNSSDGITWTSHPTTIANVMRVIYGNGLFVAVGDGLLLQSSNTTNRNIYTSPDGITWTARNSGAPTNDVQTIYDVAWGAGHFVAVDGAHHFYTSASGPVWTRTSDSRAGIRISFCKDRFFVSAGAGSNLVSTDGLAWTAVTNNTAAVFGRVLYADGCFLASDYTNLFSSLDGTNWVIRHTQIPSNLASLAPAAYANRRFLAVGGYYAGVKFIPVAYLSDPVVGVAIAPGFPPSISVSGVLGRTYRIDYLDDLQSTNWQPATTFSLSNSPTSWTDTQAGNPSRWYRAVLLP